MSNIRTPQDPRIQTRGIIDVWAQQPNRLFMEQPWLDTLLRWTGESREAPPLLTLLEAMDASGVETALLSAWYGPTGSLISNDEVAATVASDPDRLRGVGSVDITQPMEAVREVERCIGELGFVAIRLVPWLWDLPPNDRRYYPVLAACTEYDVPFCTQIGHTGPLRRSEPGRPIPYLEDVLLDFPDLVVIGGHVGSPWIHEVISLLLKFPNFYVDTSAYAVHRLPHELIDFMSGPGRDRVMFGTNWPMLSPQRALEQIDKMSLDAEALAAFLHENARRVFRLRPGSRW